MIRYKEQYIPYSCNKKSSLFFLSVQILIYTLSQKSNSCFRYIACLLLMLFSINNTYSNNTINNKSTEFDSTKKETLVLVVTTTKCKKCVDEYYVRISINHVLYSYDKITRYTVIRLPPKIKLTDTITIDAPKSKLKKIGFIPTVKVQKKEFVLGDQAIINVKIIKKKQLNFIPRKIHTTQWIF